MNNLSKDLLSYMYEYLSLKDIYNCSIVNKVFNKAFHHELLWINLSKPYKDYIAKYIIEINLSNIEKYKIIIKDINNYLEKISCTGYFLKSVPKELINGNFHVKAVKQNGYALYYVPERLKDKEICIEAVKNDGYALEYVPENLKEICRSAPKKL